MQNAGGYSEHEVKMDRQRIGNRVFTIGLKEKLDQEPSCKQTLTVQTQ